MPVSVIEFGELRNQLEMTRSSLLDYMSPEMGRVYVVAVTRDLCSACERQKPQLNELAEKTAKKHNGKVIFTRIHVRYHENSKEESRLGKDILGHCFYMLGYYSVYKYNPERSL